MNRFVRILFFLLAILEMRLLAKITVQPEQNSEPVHRLVKQAKRKKKILILSCKGGYGHVAASNMLKQKFGKEYDVKVAFPISEWNHSLDLLKKITRGKTDAIKLYNGLLKNQWSNSLYIMTRVISPISFYLNNRGLERAFERNIRIEKPDLIISVVCYINGLGLKMAQKFSIPYLMITTDTDLINWTNGLGKRFSYKQFNATIGFESKYTRKRLLGCHIPNEKILHLGFPIRQSFLKKRTNNNKKNIRKIWQVPNKKFVTMILMGGAGGASTYKYVYRLAKQKVDTHIIACVGRDNKTKERLKALQKKYNNLSLTIVPFTNKIADLMSISDVLITKPGPGSVYEAMYMNLPMIIDYTALPVHWERASIKIVENNNWGVALKQMRDAADTVNRFKNDKKFYKKIKESLKKYKKKDFNTAITHVINTMLKKQNKSRYHC